MAETPPPPANKKKRQRMMLLGVAGAALLLFLYMRSRSGTAANATSGTTDQQNAYNQGMQAQAAQDAAAGGVTPSTFADNGANAGALGNAVTTGLQGINDALAQEQQTIAGLQPTVNNNQAPPAPAAVVTINTSPAPGPPVGTGTNAAPSTQRTVAPRVSAPVAAARAAAAGKTGAAYNKAFNQAFNQSFNKHYLAAHPKK